MSTNQLKKILIKKGFKVYKLKNKSVYKDYKSLIFTGFVSLVLISLFFSLPLSSKLIVDKFEKQLVTKHKAKFSSIIIDKYISFFDKELIKNYNLVRNLPESEKKNELIFKSIQMENLIKNLKSNHEDFISIKQYRVVIKNVNPNKLGYIREEYLEDGFEYKYLIITSILFGLICSVLFVFYFGKLIKRK